jgi:Xaa-Pro aminopeptidase
MANRALESEYAQRLAKVRKEVNSTKLDALIVFSQKRSHVRYLSGYHPNYHTHSALLLVPLKHDPILWIKFGFDLARAKATSWIKDVRIAPEETNEALITGCAKAVRDFKLEKARIGIVASDLAVDELSVSLHRCLRTELPDVEFEQASDLLNSIRAIKSPSEVERMRASAQLADAVADGLRAAIKPGLSDLHAVVEAEQVARSHGAHCDIIISTDASRLAFPPNNSTFQDKSIVTCEITIQLDGYWVQTCRTFSVGKPSAAQKELFSASRKAYHSGVAAARPGNTVATVWNATQESIVGDGYGKYIEYGRGHGVGLDLPEIYPLEPSCKSELPDSMVLVIHPAIWVPERGAAWTGGPVLVSSSPLSLDEPQLEIIEV